MVIVGVLCGTLFANLFQSFYRERFFLFDTSYATTLENLQINRFVIFKMALMKYSKDFFMLCLFCTTYIGIPYIMLHSVYKGFCIGFLISTATMKFGFTGLLYFLAYITPQYLIIIPVLLYTYKKGYQLNRQLYFNKELGKPTIKYYFPYVLILIAAIALASFLEGFINAGLMKRIMLLLL